MVQGADEVKARTAARDKDDRQDTADDLFSPAFLSSPFSLPGTDDKQVDPDHQQKDHCCQNQIVLCRQHMKRPELIE